MPTLGEREIFGDEDIVQLTSQVDELAAVINDLNARLHAQFTTIAAHAEIGGEQSDLAREEARGDLERTGSTLIELIEQIRPTTNGFPPPTGDPGPGPPAADRRDRLAAVEEQVASRAITRSERVVARAFELGSHLSAAGPDLPDRSPRYPPPSCADSDRTERVPTSE